ncbi:hypothetical protein RCC89_05580 [Cytophagaceae bacterium ABcell3]|nr:hypothetical protein RCC89_05580 [Cytophagaceae bacterium ABcell3]
MEKEKEQWVNQVMGSLDTAEKADPQPFLFRKIVNKIEEKRALERPVSRRSIWQLTTAMSLLIFLNILGTTAFQGEQTDQIDQVVEEYELMDNEDFYISYFD